MAKGFGHVRFPGLRFIPGDMGADSMQPQQEQAAIIKQSLQVREKRLIAFPGDIVVGANSNITLQQGSGLPIGCVGFRFIGVTANVKVNINGGGVRTVQDQDVVSGAEVVSVSISTDATGGCIFQAWGEGV